MSIVAFLLTALVLALTPGPGLAYVVARTVASGRREGLASCLGTGLGGLLHVMAAAWGLSLLVARSATAFGVLKGLGAAYLIWLGVRLLWRGSRVEEAGPIPARGAASALREGVVVEALNVKTALFFLAFLPQFASPAEPLAPQLALLGGLCVALNTGVDVLAVFAADRLLRSDAARTVRARWMNRISGATLIGLGGLLALARREA